VLTSLFIHHPSRSYHRKLLSWFVRSGSLKMSRDHVPDCLSTIIDSILVVSDCCRSASSCCCCCCCCWHLLLLMLMTDAAADSASPRTPFDTSRSTRWAEQSIYIDGLLSPPSAVPCTELMMAQHDRRHCDYADRRKPLDPKCPGTYTGPWTRWPIEDTRYSPAVVCLCERRSGEHHRTDPWRIGAVTAAL